MQMDPKHIAIALIVLALVAGGGYGIYVATNPTTPVVPPPVVPPPTDKDTSDTGNKSDPTAGSGAALTHLDAKGLSVWNVVPAGANTLDGLPAFTRVANMAATPGQKLVPEIACTSLAPGLLGVRANWLVYMMPKCKVGNNADYANGGAFTCRSKGGKAFSPCFQYTLDGKVVKR